MALEDTIRTEELQARKRLWDTLTRLVEKLETLVDKAAAQQLRK